MNLNLGEIEEDKFLTEGFTAVYRDETGTAPLSSRGSCDRRNPLTAPHSVPGCLCGTPIPSVPGLCPLPSSNLTRGHPGPGPPPRELPEAPTCPDTTLTTIPHIPLLSASRFRLLVGHSGPRAGLGGWGGRVLIGRLVPRRTVLAGHSPHTSFLGCFFPIWSRNT